MEAQYGRDSAQYLQAQLAQERAIQHAKINALDVSNQQKASLRAAYDEMLKLSENAMEHSLAGDPQATVEFLLKYGADTLNVRLLDTAHQVLQRYAEKLSAAVDLRAQAQELRALYCTAGARPSLGEQRERQAGRLSLRTAVVAKPTVVAPIALSEIEPDPAPSPSPSPSSASSETPAT